MMEEVKSILDHTRNGLFKELPARRRRFLESRLKRVEFAAGAEVIHQGQPGGFLGIIESGQLSLENSQGSSRVLSAGDYFGIEMLHYGKPSANSVTADTDTVLQVLDRADWLAPSPAQEGKKASRAWPRLKRSGWIALVSILALAMALVVLGPDLFDHANKWLPDRFIHAGRSDLAEQYLDFALKLKPDSAFLYGKLGDILVSEDKKQPAIEAYQQAISLDEYLPWIHNNLGVLLYEEGYYALAADHFQQALDLDPENTGVYQNLGTAYYAQDLWESAADAYQSALELDFSLLDTKAAWAGLILYENRLVEARLVWEDVLQADPRHPLALQGLGVVALLEEDPALALMYLDAANYLNPDDPVTHLYIGMAWEALEKPLEASSEFRTVLEQSQDPELVDLARALLEVVEDQPASGPSG
jgi:tetratricopeptide (TPR) repeat protein